MDDPQPLPAPSSEWGGTWGGAAELQPAATRTQPSATAAIVPRQPREREAEFHQLTSEEPSSALGSLASSSSPSSSSRCSDSRVSPEREPRNAFSGSLRAHPPTLRRLWSSSARLRAPVASLEPQAAPRADEGGTVCTMGLLPHPHPLRRRRPSRWEGRLRLGKAARRVPVSPPHRPDDTMGKGGGAALETSRAPHSVAPAILHVSREDDDGDGGGGGVGAASPGSSHMLFSPAGAPFLQDVHEGSGTAVEGAALTAQRLLRGIRDLGRHLPTYASTLEQIHHALDSEITARVAVARQTLATKKAKATLAAAGRHEQPFREQQTALNAKIEAHLRRIERAQAEHQAMMADQHRQLAEDRARVAEAMSEVARHDAAVKEANDAIAQLFDHQADAVVSAVQADVPGRIAALLRGNEQLSDSKTALQRQIKEIDASIAPMRRELEAEKAALERESAAMRAKLLTVQRRQVREEHGGDDLQKELREARRVNEALTVEASEWQEMYAAKAREQLREYTPRPSLGPRHQRLLTDNTLKKSTAALVDSLLKRLQGAMSQARRSAEENAKIFRFFVPIASVARFGRCEKVWDAGGRRQQQQQQQQQLSQELFTPTTSITVTSPRAELGATLSDLSRSVAGHSPFPSSMATLPSSWDARRDEERAAAPPQQRQRQRHQQREANLSQSVEGAALHPAFHAADRGAPQHSFSTMSLLSPSSEHLRLTTHFPAATGEAVPVYASTDVPIANEFWARGQTERHAIAVLRGLAGAGGTTPFDLPTHRARVDELMLRTSVSVFASHHDPVASTVNLLRAARAYSDHSPICDALLRVLECQLPVAFIEGPLSLLTKLAAAFAGVPGSEAIPPSATCALRAAYTTLSREFDKGGGCATFGALQHFQLRFALRLDAATAADGTIRCAQLIDWGEAHATRRPQALLTLRTLTQHFMEQHQLVADAVERAVTLDSIPSILQPGVVVIAESTFRAALERLTFPSQSIGGACECATIGLARFPGTHTRLSVANPRAFADHCLDGLERSAGAAHFPVMQAPLRGSGHWGGSGRAPTASRHGSLSVAAAQEGASATEPAARGASSAGAPLGATGSAKGSVAFPAPATPFSHRAAAGAAAPHSFSAVDPTTARRRDLVDATALLLAIRSAPLRVTGRKGA